VNRNDVELRRQDTTPVGAKLVRDELVTVLRNDRDSEMSEVIAGNGGRRGWVFTRYLQPTC
jgi:hypothetical protein